MRHWNVVGVKSLKPHKQDQLRILTPGTITLTWLRYRHWSARPALIDVTKSNLAGPNHNLTLCNQPHLPHYIPLQSAEQLSCKLLYSGLPWLLLCPHLKDVHRGVLVVRSHPLLNQYTLVELSPQFAKQNLYRLVWWLPPLHSHWPTTKLSEYRSQGFVSILPNLFWNISIRLLCS